METFPGRREMTRGLVWQGGEAQGGGAGVAGLGSTRWVRNGQGVRGSLNCELSFFLDWDLGHLL